jgi:lactoylglutathione lyase
MTIGSIQLNLVVLRSPDRQRLASFYEQLGLVFVQHRHGSGPEHHSCEAGQVVFEIYPLLEGTTATTATRLGFAVDNVDVSVERLTAAGGIVVSPPQASPWGRRAVIDDPDGHRVELTERTIKAKGMVE